MAQIKYNLGQKSELRVDLQCLGKVGPWSPLMTCSDQFQGFMSKW